MRHFFEREALRIQHGQSGLVGNELTFEQEWCALDLQAALKDLGIASAVFPAGQQHKVRLDELPAVETAGQPRDQPTQEPPPQTMTPAEAPSPAKRKAVTATPKASQNLPNFISKAPPPSQASLTPKEKRRRFAELAKDEQVETAGKLAEEQAQLELSFSPAKKAAQGRKKA